MWPGHSRPLMERWEVYYIYIYIYIYKFRGLVTSATGNPLYVVIIKNISFICTFPQTGHYLPRPFICQPRDECSSDYARSPAA